MQTETLSLGLFLSQFWFSHVLLCSVLPVWVGTKGLKVRTWQKPGCALELSLHWALRPLSSGVAEYVAGLCRMLSGGVCLLKPL